MMPAAGGCQCLSLLVLAIVVAIGLVAFFIGRQRAAAHDGGSGQAAFARRTIMAGGRSCWPTLPALLSSHRLDASARPSISSATSCRSCRSAPPTAASPARRSSLGLVQQPRQRPAPARRRDDSRPAVDLRRIAAAACSQGRCARHRYAGLHDPDRRRGEQASRTGSSLIGGVVALRARGRRRALWPSRRSQPRARARNKVER